MWERLNPESDIPSQTIPIEACPEVNGRIRIHHSAVARYFAPSDVCGAGGMHHERIRSTPRWQGEFPRRDTVYVETNANLPGMRGMVVGRVLLFFSVQFYGTRHSCAFVNWLVPQGDGPDPETGLWVVKPEYEENQRTVAVIPVDCIARGAHLLPIHDHTPIPARFHFAHTLDIFHAFFVNRYIDHHAHQFVQ